MEVDTVILSPVSVNRRYIPGSVVDIVLLLLPWPPHNVLPRPGTALLRSLVFSDVLLIIDTATGMSQINVCQPVCGR